MHRSEKIRKTQASQIESQSEEDRRDARIARKGRAVFLSGKAKTVSHAQLKRKLGL